MKATGVGVNLLTGVYNKALSVIKLTPTPVATTPVAIKYINGNSG